MNQLDFDKKMNDEVNLLKSFPDYDTDMVFRKITAMLMQIRSETELREQSNFLLHLAIDYVKNWKTIHHITQFLDEFYTEKLNTNIKDSSLH